MAKITIEYKELLCIRELLSKEYDNGPTRVVREAYAKVTRLLG